MRAIDDITAERRRQVEVEGWTLDRDDEHENGELLRAAVIYLWFGTDRLPPTVCFARPGDLVPLGWPWDAAWFKPKDRRSNLIRAGALCLAERERLLRRDPDRYIGHVNHKLDLAVRELDALKAPT